MLKSLQSEIEKYYQKIELANTISDLEELRTQLLGKRGLLTTSLKTIKDLSIAERPKIGQAVNTIKESVQAALNNRKQILTQTNINKTLEENSIDTSLPGWGAPLGAIHPLTQTRYWLEDFFIKLGFEVKTGPEIETSYSNFTALNIPDNHPARALHDTFYIDNYTDLLLRTHTSTIQVHALHDKKLPLRMLATGAVYRCDSDMTHTPMFHQLEGMVLDQQSNFSDLKGLLIHFLQSFFENEKLPTRFRASYFPFTEPSAEVDIQCVICHGEKCAFCSYSGWLEVLGCGMVHPNVLSAANVPSHYQGYAFGIGIERLTLLRYRIPDIRLLFENDSRLLNQFK